MVLRLRSYQAVNNKQLPCKNMPFLLLANIQLMNTYCHSGLSSTSDCTALSRRQAVSKEWVFSRKTSFQIHIETSVHQKTHSRCWIFTQDFRSFRLDFTKSFELHINLYFNRLIVLQLLIFINFYTVIFFILCALFEKVFFGFLGTVYVFNLISLSFLYPKVSQFSSNVKHVSIHCKLLKS